MKRIDRSELSIRIGIGLRSENEMLETRAKIFMKLARLKKSEKEITQLMLDPGVMVDIYEIEDDFIESDGFTMEGLGEIKEGLGIFLEEGI